MLLTVAAATFLISFPAQQVGEFNDKANAPAPLVLAEITGTPIDISTLEASVVFDLNAQVASVVADLTFEMTADGMPLFDLRQDIVRGTIDGQAVTPDQMATYDLGKGSGTIRILQVELKAGVTHKLHLEYVLQKPQSPAALPIGWGRGKLDWDFFFSDLNNGRYMEMWFPSNLLYDHFGFEFDLTIEGAQEEHEIVTNATVTSLGDFHWKLSFPAHYTAFSHMLVVVPADKVEHSSKTITLPGSKKVVVDVYRLKNTKASLKEVHQAVKKEMERFSKSTGPWAHGDRCTVFVWSGGRSMEYDGATTTSMAALSHELHHSWYGRGVKPRSQNDGWFDEAWTVFAADGRRANNRVLDAEGRVTELCSSNPWNRTTPNKSYSTGAVAFHRIAHVIGEKKLLRLMADFFEQNQLKTVSTQEMEAFLFEATKEPAVKQVFHRYIYGREGSWKDSAESHTK
jgi:hypothetical protein